MARPTPADERRSRTDSPLVRREHPMLEREIAVEDHVLELELHLDTKITDLRGKFDFTVVGLQLGRLWKRDDHGPAVGLERHVTGCNRRLAFDLQRALALDRWKWRRTELRG